MSGSIGISAWSLAFECSPVFFTNGIATNIPGGVLPIILITEAINFPLGILSGGSVPSLDQTFAHWQPLAGTELNKWQWGEYPFANQAIAANAGIQMPKQVSMLMRCPAKNVLGYPAKLAVLVALQSAVDQHASQGGTYTIITPTGFYTNCLLTAVRDISSGESNQPQVTWQWDFTNPLVTLQQATQVQSSLIGKVTAGLPAGSSWAGLSPAVATPSSLAAPSIMPAASGAAAATPFGPFTGPSP